MRKNSEIVAEISRRLDPICYIVGLGCTDKNIGSVSDNIFKILELLREIKDIPEGEKENDQSKMFFGFA